MKNDTYEQAKSYLANPVQLCYARLARLEEGSARGQRIIDVFNGTAAYTMDLHTDAGEIRVGDDEIDGGDYTQKGGDDSITVRTDAGDIEVGNL